MISKLNTGDNHQLIMVSTKAISWLIVFLLLLTLALIVLFTTTDFDSLAGVKNLALKVGKTAINTTDFMTIKSISGIRAKHLSPSDFAKEFADLLLLSEEGRRLGLDQNQAFKEKIADFDKSLKGASDKERVAKSVYLIEELAKLAKQTLLKEVSLPNHNQILTEHQIAIKPRIRLKTILVKSKLDADKILAQATSGSSFDKLNASWSLSLYKSVGGDLGWRERSDFPSNVYERLATTPVGSLTIGMTDTNGVHIYYIVSKPKNFNEQNLELSKNRLVKQTQEKYIKTKLKQLKKQMTFYICPGLTSICKNPQENQ